MTVSMSVIQYEIAKLAKQALRRRGFASAAIITEWDKIVGEKLARYSSPQRITYPKEQGSGGALYIEVVGAAALEFSHMEQIIIERIATFFGHRAVSRLRLIQSRQITPRARKAEPVRERSISDDQLDEILAGVEDEEIARLLRSIGNAI